MTRLRRDDDLDRLSICGPPNHHGGRTTDRRRGRGAAGGWLGDYDVAVELYHDELPLDSIRIGWLAAVAAELGVVVALTFMFGFGDVFNLGFRLGVPVWVAPLVAPAVDLSILGLLLGTRHLALTGAPAEVLRPARRLLIFASVVTLALNVADPFVAGSTAGRLSTRWGLSC